MQHLILGCDPGGACPLWLQGEGLREAIPVALSPGLKADLLHWNERMSAVVAAPDRYSSANLEALRAELNDEGLALARRIVEEKAGDAKVRYLAE
jgi:hypothetical protein